MLLIACVSYLFFSLLDLPSPSPSYRAAPSSVAKPISSGISTMFHEAVDLSYTGHKKDYCHYTKDAVPSKKKYRKNVANTTHSCRVYSLMVELSLLYAVLC